MDADAQRNAYIAASCCRKSSHAMNDAKEPRLMKRQKRLVNPRKDPVHVHVCRACDTRPGAP